MEALSPSHEGGGEGRPGDSLEGATGAPTAGGGCGTGPGRAWWVAQGLILAASVALRFYRLADLPFGMHYDEAYNGLDVTAILGQPISGWPIFFTGNFGREPLHIYLMAAA